jgi:uncharacterized membrane protein YwzB
MTLEFIKKLMGWCPNTKSIEISSQISPTNFEECDQSKGEKSTSPNILTHFSGLYSRLDVRLLLPTLFFTPFLINLLFQKGVNIEFFFIGFSLSLLLYLFYWEKQMLQYDAMVKKPLIGSSRKSILFLIFFTIILFLILPLFFSSSLPSLLIAGSLRSLYSFIAGAWFLMWGNYFQLIYWEKKNNLKIYTKNENGFQKTYAFGEKE